MSSQFPEGEPAQTLYDDLVKSYPGHLGCHTAFMQSLDGGSDLRKLPAPGAVPDTTAAACNKLIAVAELVIAAIDQEKLLTYFGVKNDIRPDAAKIKM